MTRSLLADDSGATGEMKAKPTGAEAEPRIDRSGGERSVESTRKGFWSS
jgi:hypothetical protein